MSRIVLAAAGACALSAPVSAQTSPHASIIPASASATAPITPVAPSGTAVLRAQTPVVLRMAESLTTKAKAVRVGQRFNLEVAEPVMVSGVVVVPAGSPAVGEVTEVRNKGMWGKSGYIGARLVHMRVGDRTIRLAGAFDDKGTTGTGGVVAAVAFLPVAGFFTTGTSANIPMGASVKGFVDEDVPLNMQAAVTAPMTVAAPPMTVTVPATAPAARPATVSVAATK